MNIKKIDRAAPGASEDTAFTIGFKLPVRPIDANALRKRCSDFYDKYDNIFCAYEEIDNAPTLSLNTLRDAIYEDAVAHGLWEEGFDVAKATRKCSNLVMDEAIELCEEAKRVCAYAEIRRTEKLNAATIRFEEELADVIIMSMSVAGKLGIDIDAAIRRKMEINKNRPWKHGKEEKK